MDLLVYALLSSSFLFLLVALFFVLWGGKGKEKHEVVADEEEGENNAGEVVPQRRPVRGGTGRMRQRRQRTNAVAQPEFVAANEGVGGGEDGDEEEGNEDDGYYVARGASKKEAKKKEKAAKREAEAALRESRQEKQDKHAEARRLKDEAREEQERQKEAELEEFRKQQEAEAEDEYQKWKGAISLDTEGTVEQDVQVESQGLLHEFVEYIKKHKVVMLEDLAAEFGMRTQDVVQRVMSLEEMGRISGVMDDRGKFIYISPEEMQAVAAYIQRMGRVSIAHLANKSTEFIDLEPKVDELPADAPPLEAWHEADLLNSAVPVA